MRNWAVPLLAIAALVLAGCSGDGAQSSSTAANILSDPSLDEQVRAQVDVHATSTTGVVRGIVVDAAITPIAGATVSAVAEGRTVNFTTTATGAFGFQGLKPGTYFLRAQKAGFDVIQQSVDVRAAVDDPPVTKLLLTSKPGTKPSFDVYAFRGFLECNVVVAFVFVPCEDPVTDAPIGNDDYSETWNLSAPADFIHVSLVWQPTQPVGTELYMNLFEPGAYDIVGFNGGTSPLAVDVNSTALESINEAGAFAVEVSGNGEQGLAGAELEQPFDVYVVVFHNFVPPEGYAFHKDGEPVLPK